MSAADDLHMTNYYEDPTGDPVPTNHKMHKGYSPLTTNKTGQHLHNYTYDPSDTDPEEGTAASPHLAETVNENDLWVDTTPEEVEE